MTPEPTPSGPMKRVKMWLGNFWKYFGAVLAVIVGTAALFFPRDEDSTRLSFLARMSYDIPFGLRHDIRADEAVIIYLDEESHRDLKQPYNAPWDRTLHARLLEKLKAAGARAVVFDIIFDEPHADAPASDELFARAIGENGRVVLGAEYTRPKPVPGVDITKAPPQISLPYEPFLTAAAQRGHVMLPQDSDLFIRHHPFNYRDVPGYDLFPSLTWSAARLLNSPALRKPGSEDAERWLNYYGPPGIIPHMSFSLNFAGGVTADELEANYKDKVVFIGAQLSADFSGKAKDEFATPYTTWHKGSSPGVEIHATAFLNLLRGDWLMRVPKTMEFLIVILFGAVVGVMLMQLIGRQRFCMMLAVCLAVGVAVLAHLLVWRFNVWFAWLVLVVQIAVAYSYALIRHTWTLGIQKGILERSLTLHLSPARVEQLIKEPELLKPGGRQQEVSVLFTDIADFSKMAQRKTPEDLFRMLNNYYAAALKGVHQTDGTVVQLIGDAIFAVWNAPLPHPDHRVRACRAAVELHAHLADFEPRHAGRPEFVTRVGVHTGTAVVGNLGSHDWFEFTAIGETVNLASRLEGLNKHLGTCILATRAIQSAVEDEMTCRCVGLFQFKGFGNAVEVYELLVKPNTAESTRPWRAVFDEGLRLFQAGKFTAAEAKFREAIQSRRSADQPAALPGEEPPPDGPSAFYLERIEEFRLQPPPENWRGEIVMKEK